MTMRTVGECRMTHSIFVMLRETGAGLRQRETACALQVNPAYRLLSASAVALPTVNRMGFGRLATRP